jgi:hypothetical protein
MNHKVVSFYFDPMHNAHKIAEYQKKIFNYFGLNINQIFFPQIIKHQHSEMMTRYLKKLKEWDAVTLFDLDCIPTSNNTLNKALEIVSDSNTIYGNAQSSNNGIPFAAPNFLTFTRDVWDKTLKIWEENPNLDPDVFRYRRYYEGVDEIVNDVAEIFNIENRKAGTNIVLAYPTRSEGKTDWKYTGGDGFPDFEWGGGTWFSSDTFHATEIRSGHRQKVFFDVCERILNGE